MNSFYLYWSYPKNLWYLHNFKKMIELEVDRSKKINHDMQEFYI